MYLCGNACRYKCSTTTTSTITHHHLLLCKKVHLKFSSVYAKIPFHRHVDQSSCHIRVPGEPHNGLFLTAWVGHGCRLSGWQGNAGNNLSAISQEMPSSLIIRHAAVHYVFLVKLYRQAIDFTWRDSSAQATHSCFVHHILSYRFILLFLPPSFLSLHACTHEHIHTVTHSNILLSAVLQLSP